jgi:hypothetical protein
MNSLYDLKQYVTDVMITYPSLKDECLDYLQLASDEIEAGESEPNEVQLAAGSILELIEETL